MLTQSEIDAITKEAEKFAMQYLPPEEKWKEHHEIKFNEMTHYYTAGATEERQRAKVLLDEFVKLIKEANVTGVAIPISKVDEILNTYNKNKPNDNRDSAIYR